MRQGDRESRRHGDPEKLPLPMCSHPVERPNRISRLLVPIARWLRRHRLQLFGYGVITCLGVSFIFPFVWMVSTSLKPAYEVTTYPVRLVPSVWRWENYVRVWQEVPWARRWALNSLLLVEIGVIGAIISNTMIAYAFARLRFPGRDILFLVVLSVMMLPGVVTVIPTYLIWTRLGALDTYWPWAIGAFTGSSFYIFMLRQYMLGLPYDLDEAARMDGAGYIRTLVQILVPLLRAPIIAVAVFQFLNVYNDFFGAILFLRNVQLFPLSLGLVAVRTHPQVGWRLELVMAMSTCFILPMLIVYFVAQQYFIEGVALTGVRR